MNLRKIVSIITLLATCLSSCIVFAKSEITNYEIIIPPQYDEVRTFNEGYAAVKKNGKWGYINKQGEYVIQPKYDYAASFSEGKALCGYLLSETCDMSSEWNLKLIDYSGNEIDLKDKYTDRITGRVDLNNLTGFMISDYNPDTNVYDLKNTYEYWVNNGYITIPCHTGQTTHVFSSNGTEFADFAFNYTAFNDGVISKNFMDGGFVSDKFGNKIIKYSGESHLYYNEQTYKVSGVYSFNDNYGTCYVYDNDYNGHVAIIDKNGNLKYVSETDKLASGMLSTNPKCDFIVGNIEGLLCTSSKDGKHGAVDMNGNVRVPFIYDGTLPCSEGLIAVEKDGKWGYVDTYGNEVIEPQYDKVTGFNGGMALAVKDGKPYVIDRYNDVYANYEKIDLSHYFSEDGVVSALNGNIIVISENGKYGFAEFDYSIALPKEEEMSRWAHEEVVEAIESNLVPINMRNRYSENIDRADFATLVVNVLKEVSGKNENEIKKDLINIDPNDFFESNPFNDITDESIIIANKLGIVNGVSADTFDHASSITRQDAAVMIMRLVKYLNPVVETEGITFADNQQVSDYAKEAVGFVASNDIMNGTGNNEFSPLSNITKEQAYITVMRVCENLK